jgi:hypothetical protein
VCLETGKTKHKIKNLENHRVCYDKVALYIALISMIFVTGVLPAVSYHGLKSDLSWHS